MGKGSGVREFKALHSDNRRIETEIIGYTNNVGPYQCGVEAASRGAGECKCVYCKKCVFISRFLLKRLTHSYSCTIHSTVSMAMCQCEWCMYISFCSFWPCVFCIILLIAERKKNKNFPDRSRLWPFDKLERATVWTLVWPRPSLNLFFFVNNENFVSCFIGRKNGVCFAVARESRWRARFIISAWLTFMPARIDAQNRSSGR